MIKEDFKKVLTAIVELCDDTSPVGNRFITLDEDHLMIFISKSMTEVGVDYYLPQIILRDFCRSEEIGVLAFVTLESEDLLANWIVSTIDGYRKMLVKRN